MATLKDFYLVKEMLGSSLTGRAARSAIYEVNEMARPEVDEFLGNNWKDSIVREALLTDGWKRAKTFKAALGILSSRLESNHAFAMEVVRKSGVFGAYKDKFYEELAVRFSEKIETYSTEGIKAKQVFDRTPPEAWAPVFELLFPEAIKLPKFEIRDYIDLSVDCDIELGPSFLDGAKTRCRSLPPDSSSRLSGMLGAWITDGGRRPAFKETWVDAVLASSSAVWVCEQLGYGVDELVDGYAAAIDPSSSLGSTVSSFALSLGADLHECTNESCRFTVCSSLTVVEVVTMVIDKSACWEFSPAFADPESYACGLHDAEFGLGRLGVVMDEVSGPLRFTGRNVRAVHFEGTPSLEPAYLTTYRSKEIYQPNLKRSSEKFEAVPVKATARELFARLDAGIERQLKEKQSPIETETPRLKLNFRKRKQPESKPVLEGEKTTNIKIDLSGRRKPTSIKLDLGKSKRSGAER